MTRKHFYLFTISLFLFLVPSLGVAGTIIVQKPVSGQTIKLAIEVAKPGDAVIIPAGTYTNLGTLIISKDGVAGSPITLMAETPGTVTIEGAFYALIRGDHLVIKDLKFNNIRPIAAAYTIKVISFEGGAHGRVTNCSFTDIGQAGDARVGSILRFIAGANNGEIDNNTFDNWREVEALSLVDYQIHIHNNHFKNSPAGDQSSAIHAGADSKFLTYFNMVCENNLFENCLGDVETISNKSSGNTYRKNVFKNSHALVLRGGNDCVVDSNYFFSNVNGLRISGSGHKVINNYFEDTQLGSLILRAATDTYGPVSKCLIAHNTITDSNSSTAIYMGSPTTGIAPEDVTFAGNLISKQSGTVIANSQSTRITWAHNLFYISGSGKYFSGINAPETGVTIAAPALAQGLYTKRLQAESTNALGKAAKTPEVALDFDGQPRDALAPDIGADEFVMGDSADFRPVDSNLAGATFIGIKAPTSLKAIE